MGKWNTKKWVNEDIIEENFFICGNCSVKTNLKSGVDYYYYYYYYGNGQTLQWHTSDPNNKKNKSYFNSGSNARANYETYFKKDMIAWKCEQCFAINVSNVVTTEPEPILPANIEWQEINNKIKIEDIKLKKLIEEFYKTKTLKLNSSATMLARKILMHIAVEQNLEKTGKNFIVYVDALKTAI